VSAAEDVSLIAANRNDFFAVDLDLDSTHGFAQVAGSVVGTAHSASIPEL
jgi:hypothetical protein